MPNKVGSATVITPGTTDQAIPQGYYGGALGDGKVVAVVVPAANVLTGTTIAGTAGTMANNGGAVAVTPTTSNIVKPAGYYSGAITVSGDSNLIASNILSGKSIFGVAGTAINGAGMKYYATGTVTSSSGYTIFTDATGQVHAWYTISVSGLSFIPTTIIVTTTNLNLQNLATIFHRGGLGWWYTTSCDTEAGSGNIYNMASSIGTSFTLMVYQPNASTTRKRRRGTCIGSTIESLESGERVAAKKDQDNGFQDEGEGGRVVELKISSDDGDTWFRRKINMGVNLEESGLRSGEIFKLQDEQYKVVPGDDGLRAEKIKNPASQKKSGY